MLRLQNIHIYILVWLVSLVFNHTIAQELSQKRDTSSVIISPLSINSNFDEYAPLVIKNNLIFCTNSKNSFLPYYSTSTGKLLDHLVSSEIKGKDHWGAKKALLENSFIKTIQGPACINNNGTILYFTSNGALLPDYLKNPDFKPELLKIYRAEFVNGQWVNFQEFAHNQKKHSVAHPALSPDGLTLYFVSNMPGGFGGSDIYASTLKNGRWTRPKNLGPKVNSKANELFPFVSRDNILYFSSNNPTGLGNLDIYSAKLIDSVWQGVKNLGKPFNSEFDDYSYYEDQTGLSGFFSTNRKSTKDADLYRFEKAKPDCDTITPFPYCYTFFETGTLDNENLPMVYEWDFGDGNKKRGLEANHCYEKPGIYLVNLNVIDTTTGKVFFNEASYEMDVQELNKAHFDISGKTSDNNPLEFSGERSHLSDCILNEYLWDFGDGNTGEGTNVSHIYTRNGDYEVNLMVKGKAATNGTNCMSCVKKIVTISPNPEFKEVELQPHESLADVAQTIHTVKGEENLVYKVQVKSSDKPLAIDSVNFKDLKDIEEYLVGGQYGYAVGEENSLASAYPLYVDIREKGFEDAQVVAFKDGKIISGKDTARFKKNSNTQAFTQISGRIINRYGEPIKAQIILENLTTGKIIGKIESDSLQGRFNIILPNEEMYGYFAELEGYYSVSNFIDLRGERRNLEIKKNIEMLEIKELDEENLSVRLNNIFFESNQYRLQKESYSELNRLMQLLKKYPNMKVEISGHTDNTGSNEANLILSQKRADAVKDYLIFTGIDKDNILSTGYGSTKPLIGNSTERGRYLNRRVEFRLFLN